MNIQIIDTSRANWGLCKKTKGMRTKPMNEIFPDAETASQFTLSSREGPAVIDFSAVMCVGVSGDAWQQAPATIEKKYIAEGTDIQGWKRWLPKPEVEVDYFEVDAHFLAEEGFFSDSTIYLKGTWGSVIEGVENLQSLQLGDFVCRQQHDHADQWVVRKAIYDSSYQVLNAPFQSLRQMALG